MKKLLPLFLVLNACASGPTIESDYTKYRDEIEATYAKYYVQESAPFVTVKPLSEREAIVKSLCGKGIAEMNAAAAPERLVCEKKYQDMRSALLVEKYPGARTDEVNNSCKAHPVDCGEPKIHEGWVRASHNEQLELWRKGMYERLEEARRQAYNARSSRSSSSVDSASSALINLSRELQGPAPVFQNRRCTSRPNGFGAIETDCGP